MSKCLGRDISVRQHSKSEHWAPCHIQTPSRYDWKRLKATLSPNQTNKQILCHRGVQLILAYSWARPAILVAGKGREAFISSVSSLSFLFLFLPCPSLSSLLLSLPSLFSLSLGDDTKWPTRVDVSLNHNTIKILQVYVVAFIHACLHPNNISLEVFHFKGVNLHSLVLISIMNCNYCCLQACINATTYTCKNFHIN